MRKRITALVLAFLSALLLTVPCVQPASAAQEDYIAANHTRSNGNPYYIMVNRAQSTVTIYGLDENNYYTVPVKAMICSTGRTGHATPLGTYSLGGKWLWVYMLDNSYGQYVSQISGNILFHSVCYTRRDPSTLMTYEYNGLGAPASLGCVRLQTIDAKWIYDNCARGTRITVYDGASPGPLGKPEKLVEYISDEQANGWDPTDPREENPWHAILASAAQDPDPVEPEPVEPDPIEPDPVEPDPVEPDPIEPDPADPEFTNVPDWCADAVNWAVEGQITDDDSPAAFLPGEYCSQLQVLTFLWRAAGRPGSDAALPVDIAEQDLAYAETALRWAAERGVIDGTFDAGAKCTRADTVRYIWQAFGSPDAGADSFSDVPSDAEYAAAVSWAVENGVTGGTAAATFSPAGICSRAELVTFLHRAYAPEARLA